MMTWASTGWSGKTLMWLLVCLLTIATADDLWSIATASPNSELLIVADDDGPDGSTERMPACRSASVGCTTLRCFVRTATEITRPADLRNGFRLRCGPRAPPANGSTERGRKDHLAVVPPLPDSSIRVDFPRNDTATHAVAVQMLTSRAQTSGGVNRNPRWMPLGGNETCRPVDEMRPGSHNEIQCE